MTAHGVTCHTNIITPSLHSVPSLPAPLSGNTSQSTLELLAQALPFFVSRVTRDANWFLNEYLTPGEGQRNLEPVPRVQSDLPVQLIGTRKDGQASDLGKGNDPLLDNMAR